MYEYARVEISSCKRLVLPVHTQPLALGFLEEGLLDLGTFSTSLVGSKLRNAGWATNEAAVAVPVTSCDL